MVLFCLEMIRLTDPAKYIIKSLISKFTIRIRQTTSLVSYRSLDLILEYLTSSVEASDHCTIHSVPATGENKRK